MQTIAPLTGWLPVLQFVPTLQFPLPGAIQFVVPEAGHEVPPVRVNVATTVCAEFMVTLQVPVPEQPPPDQPMNVEPELGTAVRVTIWPIENGAVQVDWQEIPAGLLDTVPVPFPASPMLSWGPLLLNVAVTVWLAVMLSTHVLVPEQSPLQPVNEEPECGVAVSVTEAFAAYVVVQVPLPQLKLAPSLTEPAPLMVTLSCGTPEPVRLKTGSGTELPVVVSVAVSVADSAVNVEGSKVNQKLH